MLLHCCYFAMPSHHACPRREPKHLPPRRIASHGCSRPTTKSAAAAPPSPLRAPRTAARIASRETSGASAKSVTFCCDERKLPGEMDPSIEPDVRSERGDESGDPRSATSSGESCASANSSQLAVISEVSSSSNLPRLYVHVYTTLCHLSLSATLLVFTYAR